MSTLAKKIAESLTATLVFAYTFQSSKKLEIHFYYLLAHLETECKQIYQSSTAHETLEITTTERQEIFLPGENFYLLVLCALFYCHLHGRKQGAAWRIFFNEPADMWSGIRHCILLFSTSSLFTFPPSLYVNLCTRVLIPPTPFTCGAYGCIHTNTVITVLVHCNLRGFGRRLKDFMLLSMVQLSRGKKGASLLVPPLPDELQSIKRRGMSRRYRYAHRMPIWYRGMPIVDSDTFPGSRDDN
ncbi:hypothetical protein DAPPUDRAFT_239328 [Daphnia pulex]|uniref:Uncharacterized protein n=1 Tax=Daphnia pulex TaxID=6669 RepID=E9G905_DAPPU|nr:hypothetical protein DAPPUDRAFT_239328 [Daphnia pulex]|eukprot:EFX84180.1 hypothetical protein DAPPUDRAFT_239328 [Daphnia pulex]